MTHPRYPDTGPTCAIEDCPNRVPGLIHGWEPYSRDGAVCNDCWEVWEEHGHFPDDSCAFCERLDDTIDEDELDQETVAEFTCRHCDDRGEVVTNYGAVYVVECAPCEYRWSI